MKNETMCTIRRVQNIHAIEYDLFIYSINQSSEKILSERTEDVRTFFFHSEIELEIETNNFTKEFAFIDSN